MNTLIECLPDDEQVKQLAELVKRVVTVTAPEKIICYGCRVSITQDWGCFLNGGDGSDTVHPTFDLLLLVNENEKRPDHEIIQLVDQQAKPPISVTCIVHKLKSVNESIAAGSRFFGALSDRGALLYDSNNVPLASPPETPKTAVMVARIKEHWDMEYSLAVQFLNAATHALSNGGPVLAVFLLHQA